LRSEPLRRPHFGEGDLALDSSKSVFINCPFDAAYLSLFDAILFSIVCCGFMPRSALESGTLAEPRLARIAGALFSCRYSIHDLSRSTGEGSENLARFNMPLELGMAMARRFMDPDEHDWLLLVPVGHAYLRFVSDLAAYDPATHDGSIEGVILPVTAWLSTRRDAALPTTPREVLSKLPIFQSRRRELDAAWGGCPPWPDIVLAAISVAKAPG
jgi:hypothetical protein